MSRAVRTDNGVAKLRPRAKAYIVPVADVPGLFVRVHPTGGKSFLVIAKAPSGKQVWKRLDNTALGIADAQERGREALKRIKAGENLAEPESFDAVADEWLKRHVGAKGLRSQARIERALSMHVRPAWGARGVTTIRRTDVAKLLDGVEDDAGPVAADFVLSIVRAIFNWLQARDDDFVSPVIAGMRRSSPNDRARDRALTDDELREIWNRASGTFGAFIKALLLTGQRRDKVAAMRWADLSPEGVWTIPTEEREKGNARELVLPKMVVGLIHSLPRFDANPYVFAGRGKAHLSGFSKAKAAFDAKCKGVAPWRLHDLRRTARSLMSRAGVRPDIAERVLGHAIKGVERVYDRHAYREEKAQALRALAGLVETIVTARGPNVVAMRGKR